MAEFCKDCFLKLFGPVEEDEEIVLSEEPWLCEGCGEWVPIVDIVRKKGNKMDIIEQLETLRIPDSDFFGIPIEQRRIYAGQNEMLNECLKIVWKWIHEHHLELELIT